MRLLHKTGKWRQNPEFKVNRCQRKIGWLNYHQHIYIYIKCIYRFISTVHSHKVIISKRKKTSCLPFVRPGFKPGLFKTVNDHTVCLKDYAQIFIFCYSLVQCVFTPHTSGPKEHFVDTYWARLWNFHHSGIVNTFDAKHVFKGVKVFIKHCKTNVYTKPWRPGTHFTKGFMSFSSKSHKNISWFCKKIQWSVPVTFLQMPWQQSCHGMCKFVTWSDHSSLSKYNSFIMKS